MKFLLDQNVPVNFIKVLRDFGHEAITLKQISQIRAKNGEIGKLAIEHEAILVTFDRHFLNLKRNIQQQSKIIYIEVYPRDPIKESNLFREKLTSCLGRLKKPGVVILQV